MNIWFFNHYAVPISFYPLARTYNFAKFLLEKGHKTTIFAASTVHNSNINLITNKKIYKEETIEDIKYVYLKTNHYKTNGMDRVINMVQYAKQLFKVTKFFNKPDIIMASSVHPLTCIAGIQIAKKYDCKCVVEIADLWPLTLIEFKKIKPNSLTAKILYKAERWIYENADSIIFTMEGGKEYVKDLLGNHKDFDYSKIFYINNGVDLETFNKQKDKYQYQDADLDDRDTFKVVYTGSLGEANSPYYIVEAANMIQQKGYKNVKFIIFGSGSMKEKLEEYSVRHNLKNIVFKGKVDKNNIPNILSKSNLNIFTGKHINLYKYGLSLNKIFDYLASGKPILSNIECGYDNLKKYQCGITVKGGNAEYLAEEVINFYKMSAEKYNLYCSNALDAAREFDFKKLANKLEEIFLQTLNKK